MEVTPKSTSDRPIGSWRLDGEQVFILNEKGDRVMGYNFKRNGPVLILDGNFEISANNQKKPTFYLSKYREERNESVYGPAKK